MIHRYSHPVLFYGLSTLIPWLCWFAAAALSRVHGVNLAASLLALAGLCAPLLIGFALIWRDPLLRRDTCRRFFNFSSAPVYYLLACGLMPLSIMLAQGISLLFGYDSAQFVISTRFSFTSGVFPVWMLLIAAPLIEEIAWHSYGTDCLRSRFSLFTTCMIFAVFWGVWHMPLSAIPGYYHSELVASGWLYAANFLISIIPFVIIMNWLYYKTGRNILLCGIFHITAGLFNELFAPHPDSKVIQTGLLLMVAAALVMRERAFFFRKT
ncbi:CPBP family intramembrane metalloprotease [Serratia rubidaea]|uniref:CAAX amino terminal protease self- immunity n=2 Tax=Serratia rubidaea TaxID=61652 RepID=A0A448SC32_SERRU|nr:CPBP family intramembrane glutamic endopeptidase [Serratia rubidaea]MBH1930291.1 CPBP family intramembrane metalloprotease [Serratia rubidaea]MDC6117395.1 CPBP family intramembrane metalloprotease [Serratia rubidaea]MEB7586410.1 CPBP family intramembrane metalloprotease [Serratia rubidaea]VEI65270.1 CAAX amino terminal protease self- immunity [Serratia rubidaea]